MSRAKKKKKVKTQPRRGLSFGPREPSYRGSGCVTYEVRWDGQSVGDIFGHRDYLGWNYEGYVHLRMAEGNPHSFVWDSEPSRAIKTVKWEIKKFFAQLQPT